MAVSGLNYLLALWLLNTWLLRAVEAVGASTLLAVELVDTVVMFLVKPLVVAYLLSPL